MAQTVKHLPTRRETRVQSLGWEDLLEKEMATHSSILAWKIPWTEEPGSPRGRKELDTTEWLHFTILKVVCVLSCSVVSNSSQPHGLQPSRLLHPWDFPGKSTGVGCHFLLQRIFPTQGSNRGLLHSRQMLYRLSHQGANVTEVRFCCSLFKTQYSRDKCNLQDSALFSRAVLKG